MKKNTALLVAGLVFTIVAIVHALRIYYGWDFIIGTYSVPMNCSIAGFAITAVLALWMFLARRSNR